jgi:hypothetical protein
MTQLLYLHSNTTREQIALMPTPAPMGPRHRPYSFDNYITNVEESLDRVGFEILSQEYEVPSDHMRFFGAMEIAPRVVTGEVYSDAEYKLLVGLRGAHDQSITRGLVLGSRVTVCSNLMFSGNIANFNTKQTTFIHRRLPGLLSEAIGHIPALAQAQHEKFGAYQNYEFSNVRGGDAALVEIYRQGGLSAAQLGKAIREWDQPTYEEHARFGKSAWLLLQSVTEALKPGGDNVNHNLIANRTMIADRFLSNLVGVNAIAA